MAGHYTIVKAPNPDSLVFNVNLRFSGGWIPTGGVCQVMLANGKSEFFQATVKGLAAPGSTGR